MMVERTYSRRQIWKGIISIIMLTVGCACFIFSCVSAMILTSKD